MTGLEVRDLRICSAEAELVRGVTLELLPGRPLTLLGETGSGKSLIAQAVIGTLPPELTASGQIRLAGEDLLTLSARERRRMWGRAISLLPQEPWLALDPTMRVLGQVSEVHRLVRGSGAAEAERTARANLTAVGLANAESFYPFQMSGGMCQRASIATADAAGSKMMLADEPTKGLDAQLRDDVVARLKHEADTGRMLLTITHDVAVARYLGGWVGVMLDGQLVDYGPMDEVLTTPSHPYTRELIAADPRTWRKRTMMGRGATILSAYKLRKAYGLRLLFRDLDLEVRAGEIIALVGPSGCGKTTLGNILLGLTKPDAGSITYFRGPKIEFQKLYQDPPAAFAGHQSIRQAFQDFARLHKLPWESVEAILARLRLSLRLLDRVPGQISGGELQRFALARALLLEPILLFADETTSRLDPVSQKEAIQLLIEIVAERHLALLFVTHDRVLASKIADRTIDFATDSGLQPVSYNLRDSIIQGAA